MDARSLGVEPGSFDTAIRRLALMLLPEREKMIGPTHGTRSTRLIESQFRSPQLALWELGLEGWHLVLRLPEYAPQRRSVITAMQLPLLPQATAATG
jgi:hypothetical protein